MGCGASSPSDTVDENGVAPAPAPASHKQPHKHAQNAPPATAPAAAATSRSTAASPPLPDSDFSASDECPHSSKLLQERLEVSTTSLGKGAFGEVRLATRKADGKKVGLKIISKITFHGEEERRLMLLEAQLAYRVGHPSHPNVVTTYEYAEDAGAFYMVMELATGGELMDRITKAQYFSEAVASRYFKQLAMGLQHIHERGVVHRDLKPENFLMADASPDAAIKITDFGLSAAIATPDTVLTDACGSAFYIAPEVFKRAYTKAADVFSLGVNLYLFLSGNVPFGANAENEADVYKAIQTAPLAFGPEWAQISGSARELLAGLLEKDPVKRYTLAQALEHPWVVGGAAPDLPLDMSLVSSLQSFNAKNKFKKNVLKLVASALSAADVQALRASFMKIDTDNTGE